MQIQDIIEIIEETNKNVGEVILLHFDQIDIAEEQDLSARHADHIIVKELYNIEEIHTEILLDNEKRSLGWNYFKAREIFTALF